MAKAAALGVGLFSGAVAHAVNRPVHANIKMYFLKKVTDIEFKMVESELSTKLSCTKKTVNYKLWRGKKTQFSGNAEICVNINIF
ncbi:MAG: hypothetical protein BWK79_02725 [Beggiatoa sp. IS2]|nr:MAG: hypothetical protein BWK79_02725 [Beggiatoa sp. IS2]